MHQANATSCAKQEMQPNKNKVKLIHFKEILSSPIDAHPVKKQANNNTTTQKYKTSVFLRKNNNIRFLQCNKVLEKPQKPLRAKRKTWHAWVMQICLISFFFLFFWGGEVL